MGPPPTAADPQATHIANVTGYSESHVLLVLAAVLGIAIELVSCFSRYALDGILTTFRDFRMVPPRAEIFAVLRIDRRPDGTDIDVGTMLVELQAEPVEFHLVEPAPSGGRHFLLDGL